MSLEVETPCRAKCSAAWPGKGANFAVCACSLVSYSTPSSLQPRLVFHVCGKSMSVTFRGTSLIQCKHKNIPRTISSTAAAAGDGKSSAAAARALDGLPSGAEPTEDLIGGCGSGLGEVIKHCRSVSRNTIWSISLGSEAESTSHLTTSCTARLWVDSILGIRQSRTVGRVSMPDRPRARAGHRPTLWLTKVSSRGSSMSNKGSQHATSLFQQSRPSCLPFSIDPHHF